MSHLKRNSARYNLSPVLLSALLASLLFASAATLCAQSRKALPQAPKPVPAPSKQWKSLPNGFVLPGKPAPGVAGSVDRSSRRARVWALYADPGERTPDLTRRQKMVFWLHEEARPSSTIPEFLGAGYGQLTGTPAYGSDSGAFGERLGAAFIRDASMRFFVSSLVPTITGEDPRYFRSAHGTWRHRSVWALDQAIVLPRPDGSRGVNLSNIVGHLAASILTIAYYPEPSVTPEVVLQTWGTSIAGTAGNNLILEFWPDVVHKVIHRKQWLQSHSP